MTTEKSAQARSHRGAHAVAAPKIAVLHIDDDPNDSELFRAAVAQAQAGFELQNVKDADQALAYLNGVGDYADRILYPLPALILLDLKMPRRTGFEVLTWIRNHPELKKTPVVVLSGSQIEEDRRHALTGGADSYLVKPLGFAALVALVQQLETAWLTPKLSPAAPPQGCAPPPVSSRASPPSA